ncbi:unnamed protein product [Lathyrus sativus]|nr:unnamed protein product [Lathyrus sativus]
MRYIAHLSGLRNRDCRHESLPEKGLSTSLSVLTVKCCLLLQASSQNNGGKEWHKIAHMNHQPRKKPAMIGLKSWKCRLLPKMNGRLKKLVQSWLINFMFDNLMTHFMKCKMYRFYLE